MTASEHRFEQLAPIGPVTRRAHDDGRDYIAPEDVAAALVAGRKERLVPIVDLEVQLEVLRVLSCRDGWGVVDSSLCAAVASWSVIHHATEEERAESEREQEDRS